MKKWLLSTLTMTMLAGFAQAEPVSQPYSELKKQVEIMSGIIKTSLETDKGHRRSIDVKGVYIKSQGVTFEITKRGRFEGFEVFQSLGDDFGLELDSLPPVAPLPPIPPIDDLYVGLEDNDRHAQRAERIREQRDDQLRDAMRDRAEHTRALRDAQREMEYEVRNFERNLRDLTFEQRHAEKQRSEEIDKDIASIKAEMAKLENKGKEIQAKAEKEEALLKQARQQQLLKAQEAQQMWLTMIEQNISQSLCGYGAGLRDLDKQDKVNFIINIGRTGQTNEAVKKIYSFGKKDILACVTQDKTVADLLKSGEAYYY